MPALRCRKTKQARSATFQLSPERRAGVSHKRYYIRDGAKTTADGIVRASSTFCTWDGLPLAREGDRVDCPTCGEEGVIQCVAPRLRDRSEGKECALSDDLCICGCSPPPKLLADQFSDYQVVTDSPAA
jgi:uncharacterized Zn-binding protein involved in type VI secretion